MEVQMETVGVTGTLHPTPRMVELLTRAIAQLPRGTVVVQGGAIGIDHEAARIAHGLGLGVWTIYPANKSQVSTTTRIRSTHVEEMPLGTSYRKRNERVVALSSWLIAVPGEPDNGMNRGSGTWMTVRIARRAGKPVTVLEDW
jgi:predicted Rossmann fold nucleotide-binding protein DprA/Smf involved in DNA uptake